MSKPRPTLHVTNWSSRRLHGPGRRYSIMAKPRRWERGDGVCIVLVPQTSEEVRLLDELVAARRHGLHEDRVVAAYRRALEQRWAEALTAGHLSPGKLGAGVNLAGGGAGAEPVCDGDTLLCACSREDAAAGRCHRAWAAPFLVRAGWRALLDGQEVADA